MTKNVPLCPAPVKVGINMLYPIHSFPLFVYHETVGQSPATSHCCRSVTFSAVCVNPSVAVRQDFKNQDHAQCTEVSFHNEQRDDVEKDKSRANKTKIRAQRTRNRAQRTENPAKRTKNPDKRTENPAKRTKNPDKRTKNHAERKKNYAERKKHRTKRTKKENMDKAVQKVQAIIKKDRAR